MSNLIQWFNRSLDKVSSIEGSPSLIDLELYQQIVPTEPGILKIYYPISRNDEFPPASVIYELKERSSVGRLLHNILEVYQTPLPPETVQAYVQANSDYSYLLEETQPQLYEVLHTVFIERLKPYQDGYLLILSS